MEDKNICDVQSFPLVSIDVISYNSQDTVLETLESIRRQTYPNIELIISDDCSRDQTIELCKDWLAKNGNRFVRTKLIVSAHNTGVVSNCNRALNECMGVWEKGIAADDILMPTCIEDYVSFVKNNPDAYMVSSLYNVYNDTFEESNCIARRVVASRHFFELSAQQQLKKMAVWNRIASPTLFVKTELKKNLGGYDGRYSFEDYPFMLNAIKKGYRCFFMDKESVCYRMHQSITHSSGQLFNYGFMKESRDFHEKECYPYLNAWQRFGQNLIWGMQSLIVALGLNRNNKIMNAIYRLSSRTINTLFFLN